MKFLLIIALATGLYAVTNKQIIVCQIKARDIGNSIDRVGLNLIENKSIKTNAKMALSQIDNYLLECRGVDKIVKLKIGRDNHKQMIEWRRHIQRAIDNAKEIKAW